MNSRISGGLDEGAKHWDEPRRVSDNLSLRSYQEGQQKYEEKESLLGKANEGRTEIA